MPRSPSGIRFHLQGPGHCKYALILKRMCELPSIHNAPEPFKQAVAGLSRLGLTFGHGSPAPQESGGDASSSRLWRAAAIQSQTRGNTRGARDRNSHGRRKHGFYQYFLRPYLCDHSPSCGGDLWSTGSPPQKSRGAVVAQLF